MATGSERALVSSSTIVPLLMGMTVCEEDPAYGIRSGVVTMVEQCDGMWVLMWLKDTCKVIVSAGEIERFLSGSPVDYGCGGKVWLCKDSSGRI